MKKVQRHSAHDAAFKGFMAQIENAKDFFIFIYQSIFMHYVILKH